LDLPFQEFFKFVHPYRRFLVSCHIHPDGDAIGSTLTIGAALSQMNKQAVMVCNEEVPNVYKFLEGSSQIKRELPPDFIPEVLLCVDCAEKERIALPANVWEIPGLQVLNIDHHITNTNFGDYNLVSPNAAATGEVIFSLLSVGQIPLSHTMATALYIAIATDTGFFRYTNTSGYTLEVASLLVKEHQLELAKIAEQVHEQKSFNSIRLLGEVLSTIQIGIGGKVAWAVLDQQMLSRYSVENEETESYVNYPRSIEGVEVGILFKELRPGEVKLSWRSTTAVDVSKLAANFGGGGHARAAGCNMNGPLKTVISEVLSYIDNFYHQQCSTE
jgi:phosphoesterase RecJ-like protein